MKNNQTKIISPIQISQSQVHSSSNIISSPILNIQRVFKKSSSSIPQNVRLSNYLVEIQDILNSAESMEEAQKDIENTWLDIAKNSFSDNKEVFKNKNSIFKKSYTFLLAYHQKGDLKRKVKWLADYLLSIDFIFLAFSHLITSFNKKNQLE